MSDKDDPVIKALRMADNALSGMTEDEVSEGRVGQAVMANKAIQKAIAIQKAQALALKAAQEYCWSAAEEERDVLEKALAVLDEVKKTS